MYSTLLPSPPTVDNSENYPGSWNANLPSINLPVQTPWDHNPLSNVNTGDVNGLWIPDSPFIENSIASIGIWNPSSIEVDLDDFPSTSESLSEGEEDVKPKRKKEESPKICAVCGDKASGLNYEVPSCYGCKSFFRRTLQNQKRFACNNEGQCKFTINKDGRLRCRSCRFNRCVELGMNPLAVNAIKDKDTNKMVHEVLRHQRQLSKTASTALVPMPRSLECKYNHLIEEMMHLEDAHQRLRRSQFNPKKNPEISIEWCLQGHSRLGIDFGDMPIVCPPPPLGGPFVPMQVRIRDRIPYPYLPIEPPIPVYKKWAMVDLCYTIEWLKTLYFFNLLQTNEQLQLVKNVTQMVTMLAAAFYSYEVRKSDVAVMPDGSLQFEGELPKEAMIERANNIDIISRLKSIQMDKGEYVLLKAIMACDPDHDCFSPESRRMLQAQREIFTKSLMSYVLARRGAMKGPSAFTEMLAIVTWQQQVLRKHKELHILLLALKLSSPWLPKVMLQVFSA